MLLWKNDNDYTNSLNNDIDEEQILKLLEQVSENASLSYDIISNRLKNTLAVLEKIGFEKDRNDSYKLIYNCDSSNTQKIDALPINAKLKKVAKRLQKRELYVCIVCLFICMSVFGV